MRAFFIRLVLIVLAVLFQVNFLNILFSGEIRIDILSLVVLSWVIVASFEEIWLWIFALGVLSDLILFDKVGVNVIFFISIAYAISFFSRRFLIERKLEGILVVVLFVTFSFVFLDLGRMFVSENLSFIDTYIRFKEAYSSWKVILIQNILNILFFYVVYFFINKIEKNIERYKNKVNIIS